MSRANLSLKPTKLVARKSGKGGWRRTKSHSLGKFLVAAWLLICIISPVQVSAFVRAYACPRSPSSRTLRMTAKPEEQLSLGILSFDLDDTLFSTSAVINDANLVMLEKMRHYGVDVHEDEFLDVTKQIRKSLLVAVTYTSLRKMAIAQLLSVTLVDDCEAIVDECFDAWLNERHCAAERYLFPQTLTCLSTLKETYPDTCFAAITNGRGNPLCMPVLADFFDFCVSGEDDGVFPARKPAPGIYSTSLNKYKELYPHHDHNSRIWVHVGDCLVNDVGASAYVGAYAVWFSSQPSDEEVEAAKPKWSTATSSEQNARKLQEADGREKIAVRISWYVFTVSGEDMSAII